MKIALAVLLLSAMPLSAASKKQKALDLAVYAASEFDGATTYAALQDCGSRCYEANPMLRPFADNPSIFPVMALSAWGVNYLAVKIGRHHRRWAVILQGSVAALHIAAGAHNLAAK